MGVGLACRNPGPTTPDQTNNLELGINIGTAVTGAPHSLSAWLWRHAGQPVPTGQAFSRPPVPCRQCHGGMEALPAPLHIVVQPLGLFLRPVLGFGFSRVGAQPVAGTGFRARQVLVPIRGRVDGDVLLHRVDAKVIARSRARHFLPHCPRPLLALGLALGFGFDPDLYVATVGIL